jgi:hypothetical protein
MCMLHKYHNETPICTINIHYWNNIQKRKEVAKYTIESYKIWLLILLKDL